MSVDEVVIVTEVPVFCPQCDVSVLFVSGPPYSPLSLSFSPALYAPPSSPAFAVAFLMLATDAIIGPYAKTAMDLALVATGTLAP